MTREEMEELKGLAASMGLYDDKNPCKRAVILGKAIKVIEQQPKIKVLDSNEAARKLGAVDVYRASTWITLLRDLEYLGLKICEVEE